MIIYENDGPVIYERWSRPDIDGGREHREVVAVVTAEHHAFRMVDVLNRAVKERASPFETDVRADPTFDRWPRC